MINLRIAHTNVALLFVMFATGCASLDDIAGEVSTEVSTLAAEAATHRRLELLRITADTARVDDMERLTDVQAGLAEDDRTVLAMASAKTVDDAWRILDARLAAVEAVAIQRAIEDPAAVKAPAELTPMPTKLMAALVKELDSLVSSDRKASLDSILAYGEAIAGVISSLQKDAETKAAP